MSDNNKMITDGTAEESKLWSLVAWPVRSIKSNFFGHGHNVKASRAVLLNLSLFTASAFAIHIYGDDVGSTITDLSQAQHQ